VRWAPRPPAGPPRGGCSGLACLSRVAAGLVPAAAAARHEFPRLASPCPLPLGPSRPKARIGGIIGLRAGLGPDLICKLGRGREARPRPDLPASGLAGNGHVLSPKYTRCPAKVTARVLCSKTRRGSLGPSWCDPSTSVPALGPRLACSLRSSPDLDSSIVQTQSEDQNSQLGLGLLR
jgi:hypothetical protein